jgi:hypothetical protein
LELANVSFSDCYIRVILPKDHKNKDRKKSSKTKIRDEKIRGVKIHKDRFLSDCFMLASRRPSTERKAMRTTRVVLYE